MANARLELADIKTTNEATLEFITTVYTVRYTHIEYLKAMNIYGQLDKLKNTSEINWTENCETAVNIYNEAERILKNMIGGAALASILREAGIELDIISVAKILAACVEAISNKIAKEESEKLEAEISKLDIV